ncbi:MAG TPA: glycosyltransferase family 4 protein [Bryobacteraceae bacterium]|jgi:glycosyltransferase involved in cell wall biosynthesis|nr:glycosyltransferase family 4 protein [Bryobacteraceae bacterium]
MTQTTTSACLATPEERTDLSVAILTGGIDPPYVFGLTMALASKGIQLDVIGSDLLDRPEMHSLPQLRFLNLQRSATATLSHATRAWNVLAYYWRLLRYVATAEPRVFHILWNNKLWLLDRTLLLLYCRAMGKRLVFTAHNVNSGKRDQTDSLLNRITLRLQYHLVDHVFVHTDLMKAELAREFAVSERVITVIPFGINNSVPDTTLTRFQARERLAIKEHEQVVLFYGRIAPYKGLDILLSAFKQVLRHRDCRLVIAGEPKGDSEKYTTNIRDAIRSEALREQVTARLEFIPDEDTEVYFKAADVAVLPYTSIFQSGVLFLAYRFGLPVIASDVGSFRLDIVEGQTGFLCRPCDAGDLARTINKYFDSPLFKSLAERRQFIRQYAETRQSWDVIGAETRGVYVQLLNGQSL